MRYVIKAFINHWNLLGVCAGTALGIISGMPDIILPIVAALEILYLSYISTRPNFQKVVDAVDAYSLKVNKAGKPRVGFNQTPEQKSIQILKSLTAQEQDTFEQLKKRCLDLHGIARQMKDEDDELTEGQTDPYFEGINRLLWIYLKLLYSRNALDKFFRTIDKNEIENNIRLTKERMQKIDEESGDDTVNNKRRKVLEDTLETLEQRQKNYRQAKENYEYIEVELARLNTKVSNLAEMGIGNQTSEVISREIDVVSDSVASTEKIMNELAIFTGISLKEERTPVILRRRVGEGGV